MRFVVRESYYKAWEFFIEERGLPPSLHFSVIHQEYYSPDTLSPSPYCRNIRCQWKKKPVICTLVACLAKSSIGTHYNMPETKYCEDWTAECVPATLTTRCFLQVFFFFSKISIWVQTPFLKTVREINVTVDNMVWFLWGGLSWEQKTLRARFKPNNRSTFKGKNSSLFTLVFYFMSLRNGNKFAFSPFFLFFFSSFFLCLAFFFTCCVENCF